MTNGPIQVPRKPPPSVAWCSATVNDSIPIVTQTSCLDLHRKRASGIQQTLTTHNYFYLPLARKA